MPKKRVMVYAMHEHEIADASSLMGAGAQMEGSLLLGELDDAQIEELRSRNIILRVLEAPWTSTAPPSMPGVHGLKRVSAIGISTPVASATARPSDYYIIELDTPMITSVRRDLELAGAQILNAEGNEVYKIAARAVDVDRIQDLPFVRGMQVYRTEVASNERRMQEDMLLTGDLIEEEAEPLLYDLLVHRVSGAAEVKQWLKDHDVSIVGDKGLKIRIKVAAQDPILDRIAALPDVSLLEEYVPPKLYNDRAREILRIESPNPGALLTQTGAGQIVAVADTGIDDQHPDLRGRIIGIEALGRPGNYSDTHGHGTHVAGSILGDGLRSGGRYRGTAPGAQLYFQSLLDARGGLGGLPLDLDDLFESAYQAGARIHNNSWGARTSSRYTINASEVDAFIHRRKNMLVIIAAGNEGTAAVRINSATGFVDWLSIGSPASCKNALTVGASRSDRTQGGLAQLTYKQVWPRDFPDPPIANERCSGDPEALAAFSSRGPTDDRRIKPDVVAPGTDILSTRSRLAPDTNFHGGYPPDPDHYAYMGGTSMATPLVAGCAALVREWVTTDGGHPDPSAALLKALLINGTTWLRGADSTAAPQGAPNFHQGFGRVDMLNTMPSPMRPAFKVHCIDNWKLQGTWFNRTGDRARWRFRVDPGCPELRICMAYTDMPARGLQNNLDLLVELPNGQKRKGNSDLPLSLGIPDPDNNVEVVRISQPQPGEYLVQILATNLLSGGQDYALVVSGENVTPITHYQ